MNLAFTFIVTFSCEKKGNFVQKDDYFLQGHIRSFEENGKHFMARVYATYQIRLELFCSLSILVNLKTNFVL